MPDRYARPVPGHPIDPLRAALAAGTAAPAPADLPAGTPALNAARLADPDLLGALLDQMCAEQGVRHRPRGAVDLVSAVAYGAVGPAAVGLYLLDRVADPGPDTLWFRTGRPVSFARPAYDPPRVALVGPAHHPDAVPLPDRAALTDWTARRLVATMGPIVAALRRVSQVGPRTSWSFVADSVHFATLIAARDTGRAEHDAWRHAADLVAAMARYTTELWARPRPFPVLGTLQPVRAACCFAYREGQPYCTSCPLLTDDERRDRLTTWLTGA